MKILKNKKYDGIAYMYCSLTALLNIIKTKEIYASDPLKMNDSEELLWFLKEFKNIKDYKRLIHKLGFEASIDQMTEILVNNGQNNIFISCFSKLGDNLSLWRGYGDDGRGVAIGFDVGRIATSHDSAVTYDVIYGSPSYEDVEESFLEFNSFTDIIDDTKRQAALLNHLLFYSAQYKNPSFIDEGEIRIIFEKYDWLHNVVKRESKSRIKNDPFFTTEYRIINNGLDIIEYTKVPIPDNSIKTVILGPKCKLGVTELERILHNYLSYTPDVLRSDSSYR